MKKTLLIFLLFTLLASPALFAADLPPLLTLKMISQPEITLEEPGMGHFEAEISNISDEPIGVLGFWGDIWRFNALLVQYSLDCLSSRGQWQSLPVTVKTMPAPELRILKPHESLRLKVPVELESDTSLCTFRAKYETGYYANYYENDSAPIFDGIITSE